MCNGSEIEVRMFFSIFDMNIYTTFTNFSMKYLLICKVYTDVGGMK